MELGRLTVTWKTVDEFFSSKKGLKISKTITSHRRTRNGLSKLTAARFEDIRRYGFCTTGHKPKYNRFVNEDLILRTVGDALLG